MSGTGKYLILTGLGGAALAVFATAIVLQHRDPASQPATKIEASAPSSSGDQKPLPNLEEASAELAAVESIPPLPADATFVPDEDLLKLSTMVDLAGAATHRPNKDRWRQALAVSQKLMEGPCDCEQRNWLSRFGEMGNFALTNSETEYRNYATLMSNLGRNDNQAMAMSKKP